MTPEHKQDLDQELSSIRTLMSAMTLTEFHMRTVADGIPGPDGGISQAIRVLKTEYGRICLRQLAISQEFTHMGYDEAWGDSRTYVYVDTETGNEVAHPWEMVVAFDNDWVE